MSDKPLFTVRTDLIPGMQLSPFGTEEYTQSHAEFSRIHLCIVQSAAESASDRIADIMLRIAHSQVAHNQFRFKGFGYGGYAFQTCAFNATNLPYLLWLAARARHPKTIISEMRTLVDAMGEEERDRVMTGVLELVGYAFEKKDEKKTDQPKTPPTQSQSTSPPSSPPSENADSDTTKSAA